MAFSCEFGPLGACVRVLADESESSEVDGLDVPLKDSDAIPISGVTDDVAIPNTCLEELLCYLWRCLQGVPCQSVRWCHVSRPVALASRSFLALPMPIALLACAVAASRAQTIHSARTFKWEDPG